jgi:exodeoxyribonuclease V alpha subunit
MNFTDKKIVVKVERILYPKPDALVEGSSFYILRTDLGVVKGKLSHIPKQGERLNLEGNWQVSKYNGTMEFSFMHSSVYLPRDERAMLKYACEMTLGFGPALEEKIWAAKGEDWRTVSEVDGVRGLSSDKLNAFQSTVQMLENQQERTAAISWLINIGLTVKMAESAYDKWNKNVTTKVTEDCYILARLPNYGFKDVDEHVRQHFEIGRNDPRRISACLKYYLGQLTQEHTVCSWNELYDKVSKAIDADPIEISNVCRELFNSQRFVAFPERGMIASAADHKNESLILQFVRAARETPGVKARQPYEREYDLDETQMAAVQYALDHTFSIINGGAGCGKTSLIKAICDSLRGDVELCAFAGKAAARLKEATGHDAGTIHRMLKFMGEDRGFTLQTLEGKTVILDEASMVSSDLMAEIVKRRPSRLILVGDEAQLPPVGSGQPFHDIIRICPSAVQTLSKCYRNQEAVYQSALKIRNGEIPEGDVASEKERWIVQSIRDARSAHNEILRAVRSGEVDFESDIILCCRNGEKDGETECSVIAFNRDIKDIVNPNEDGSYKITPGDRVINTKNHADLDVWNGTTGVCDKIDTDGAMWVHLDYKNATGEDRVLIPKKEAREWQLAYALTVHKSQGSQYRKVFFVVTRRDQMNLLDRPMVYTAVTRTKSECRVVGDVGAFHGAIRAVKHKMTVMQELGL